MTIFNSMCENNQTDNIYNIKPPMGRFLSLDLGTKFIGVAVSDELHISARPLPALKRTSWKKLLISISELVKTFDAKALVIGLPINIDNSESSSSQDARRLSKNFNLSLQIPVYLQDERLTTVEAKERIKKTGKKFLNIKDLIDSYAAAIILEDFLSNESRHKNKAVN